MKILLGNKFFFLKGGAETVFFQERNYLLRNGYEVIEFSMKHPQNKNSLYSDYFVPNVEYRNTQNDRLLKKIKNYAKIASSFVHNNKAVENIKRLIDKEEPDIAHLHNIYHQITPSILPVLHNAGVKIVLTLHDYKLICPNYLMLTKGKICQRCEGKSFWHAGLNRCEQGCTANSLLLVIEAYWHYFYKSYEYVDTFIAPSFFMAELVSKFRITKEKITVLRNGVDIEQFTVNDDDEGYALYFGRLSREKGIETFLEAHALIQTEISAKVVGTGFLLEDLKTRFPDVEFLGYKQGQELIEIIRKAAFVVVPSEWYENCSMVVLEAMALGKPIIGSKIGGIPEQIDNGKTGFLFKMADKTDLAEKMTILLKDKMLRKTMGKAARLKLEQEYSLKSHFEGLIDIYKSMKIKKEQ
nr:glycosyltransferase family 4 protein [uncultured Desulfobacter sp.]